MLETPGQLATRYERGEIDRTEFQTLMAIHARELITEIEEDYQNPLAAWIEMKLAMRVAKKLLKKHTTFQIREALTALSEAPGFPLAKYLWNAPHPDVPLHCFFRIRKNPTFQILSMETIGDTVELHVEIYRPRNRERIVLNRDDRWRLTAPSFSKGVEPA
ncbi:MAG: hypothetical protein NWR51_10795 [Akkermansiaceae bacterium]|jgi:hypothetical protein|nr:hypothetical protein [Akkermansiaceae bacterium]MDP4847737.1 hypothetical protein [Akkermansiaceae bacterium]MDP4996302.1 hypothetical protein [Akkermansiaceae bacterium]